jgi:hypothetical protein
MNYEEAQRGSFSGFISPSCAFVVKFVNILLVQSGSSSFTGTGPGKSEFGRRVCV